MKPKVLPFPLSKTMDPRADFPLLAEELRTIEAYDVLRGQHPLRTWEYAMAHRAIREWQTATMRNMDLPGFQALGDPLNLCDIGGAGSRFCCSLAACTTEIVTAVDPNLKVGPAHPRERVEWFARSVEDHAATASHNQYDVLTAISVIEHVSDLRPFFRACHMLLKPGGLLFLTTDYWDCDGPDTAHFHWMRLRIYNEESIKKLRNGLNELGFKAFGRSDWGFNGCHIHDYTLASLAMVKG